MLRMPKFEVHLPRTVAEAVQLRVELPESLYVAGGTDLLPNLKHGLHRPRHLVSLAALEDFVGIEPTNDGGVLIRAGTSLQQIADSPLIRRDVAGLARATGLVAGPQHRRMGTLGGNVMLDTRCLFYNQSESWRRALGYCLKAEGTWCHVIDAPRTCVAAHSADSVPVLLAVDATLEAIGPEGPVSLRMREMFAKQDGRAERLHALDRRALLTAIRIPGQPGRRSHYRKVRARGAVDYPQLGVGFSGVFEGEVCTDLAVVLTAVMPQPRLVRGTDLAHGTPLDDTTIAAVVAKAVRQAKPQTAVHGDKDWRKHMVSVEVRRGLEELRAS